MGSHSILVVDDDRLARDNIAHELAGHKVDFACDAREAKQKLSASKRDICFIDLELGDGEPSSGLQLIPLAKAKGAYSVVMSGHDSESFVDQANGLGCDLFFSKLDVKGGITDAISRYERQRRRAAAPVLTSDAFLTSDPATRTHVDQALKYAASDLPILILGPSGTGKTTLARVVHEQSGRSGQFVSINCASYSDDLLEVELFGHKKGAYTDAKDTRKGKLLLADRGTLFLDEIGAMSAGMQTKLLKALEEREFYPLGSDEPERSNFRIVSATLEDPAHLIQAGKLRLDFYERIHGVTVRLPALAQRRCDILPLVEYFNRKGRKLSFSTDAKDRLSNHSWPGNIRELQKLIELLKVDEEGRVTKDRVERLLSGLPMLSVQDGGLAVTEEQYRYAVTHGLWALIHRTMEAVIRRNLAEHSGRKGWAAESLKISKVFLYKVLSGEVGRRSAEGSQ